MALTDHRRNRVRLRLTVKRQEPENRICRARSRRKGRNRLFRCVLNFSRTRCELASRSTRMSKPTPQMRPGQFGHEYCFIAWYAYEPAKPERQLHHRSVAIELEIGDICWTYARVTRALWPRRPSVDPNHRLDQSCELRSRRTNHAPGKFGALDEQRSPLAVRCKQFGVAYRPSGPNANN